MLIRGDRVTYTDKEGNHYNAIITGIHKTTDFPEPRLDLVTATPVGTGVQNLKDVPHRDHQSPKGDFWRYP